MTKSIYATTAEVAAHKSLTDAIGLQNLVIASYEFDESHARMILICVPR